MIKSKLLTLLVSLLAALGLWLYVATNVSTEREQTFSGVSVTLENASSLMDKGLMVKPGESHSVTFTLSGSLSELDKLNTGNLKVMVDLSTITEPGQHQCDYRVVYPSGTSGVSRTKSNDKVTITVVEYASKTVPVELILLGDEPEELFINTAGATIGVTEVGISGPKSEVEAVTKAGIEIYLPELTGTYTAEQRYTLMNEDNEPVKSDNISTDTGEIYVNLPVEYFKTIPLVINCIPGGGAKEKDAVVNLDVQEIIISGSQEAIAGIDSLVVAEVDLALVDLKDAYDVEGTIRLDENLTNHSGVTTVTGTVRLKGLIQRKMTLSAENIELRNVPEGMMATISTLKIEITVRGVSAQVTALTIEQIRASIDLTGVNQGITMLDLNLEFPADKDIGAVDKYQVTVTLSEKVDETTAPD